MKNIELETLQVEANKLSQHPLHKKHNSCRSSEQMEYSLQKMSNRPIYKIIVVHDLENDNGYLVIAGMIRLQGQINLGVTIVEVLLAKNLVDGDEIEEFIIELNKQKELDGKEKLSQFRYYKNKYSNKTRKQSRKIPSIAKEIGWTENQVKEFDILDNFFVGEGDVVLERILEGTVSTNQCFKLKKVVEQFPEKFNCEKSFEKVCQGDFDLERLEYGVNHLSIDDDDEFEILKSYLNRKVSIPEFKKTLEQLGKVQERQNKHEESKIFVPTLTDDFISKNARVINGNNREIEPSKILDEKLRALIGSCPYGDKRQNSDHSEDETGHNMDGQEYGKYLADTYAAWKPYLTNDGSIYVVIDDYKYQGALACSLEYFVTAMLEQGFYLVSRYKWIKRNPMPRGYDNNKEMVPAFEMAYRFVVDKDNYYVNPDFFIETGDGIKVRSGCTNHSKNGKTTRGGNYVQGNLKKVRNTVSIDMCDDVIESNVANPEDWFRQANERRHTSQYPPELSALFILEGSASGDTIGDIWNGVGNTMIGALLTGRKYLGVEIEDVYFQQTCRRVQQTEEKLLTDETPELLTEKRLVA